MPLRNRVTPMGEIVAIPERGLFTGNRGILHDPATKALTKQWALKAWLVCVLEFQNRHREVMAQRSWTELFFLDEATALAAGHRPCFHCRRAEAGRFRQAFIEGASLSAPLKAPAMDAILHNERLFGRAKRLHPIQGSWRDLPDGAMISSGSVSYLVKSGEAFPWSPSGYCPPTTPTDDLQLITPPSIVHALKAGYKPALHPSLASASQEPR